MGRKVKNKSLSRFWQQKPPFPASSAKLETPGELKP
jgi:hypothetical protein